MSRNGARTAERYGRRRRYGARGFPSWDIPPADASTEAGTIIFDIEVLFVEGKPGGANPLGTFKRVEF